MRLAIALAMSAVVADRCCISSATTLNAAPAVPALAASMRALSANRCVLELTSLIWSIASVSVSERSPTKLAIASVPQLFLLDSDVLSVAEPSIVALVSVLLRWYRGFGSQPLGQFCIRLGCHRAALW